MLALEGIRVLDLSRLAPGPYCSMLLADLGADVLLVEEPAGTGGRLTGQAARRMLERDISEPGQYVVLDIGRESIIVSCGPDGDVVANYNVCQHRGARILVDRLGCAQHYTCPYHGWAYRSDGRLIVVPDNNRFPGGVDRAQHSLRPVRAGTGWQGEMWNSRR